MATARKTRSDFVETATVADLLGAFEANFGGGMERMSKTWEGRLSNMKDAIEQFWVAVGNSGFLEYLSTRAVKQRRQGGSRRV